MYQVDVLEIIGCPNAQAVVVEGILLASHPEEGIGDFLCAPAQFFDELGVVVGVQFTVAVHQVSAETLGLNKREWEWSEVVERFLARSRSAVHSAGELETEAREP